MTNVLKYPKTAVYHTSGAAAKPKLLDEIKDVRNGSGAAATGGLILLGAIVVISGPVGWAGAFAGALIIGGGGGLVVSQKSLDELRSDCVKARDEMYDAYQRAMGACEDP